MSKKKKPEEPLPKQYAAGSAFSASVLLRPRGESIDVEWPDGGMCAVLTHDEIMHFRNLAAFAALRRGMPSRAIDEEEARGDFSLWRGEGGRSRGGGWGVGGGRRCCH